MISKEKIEALILSDVGEDILVGVELLSQVTPSNKCKEWCEFISDNSYKKSRGKSEIEVILLISTHEAAFYFKGRFFTHNTELLRPNAYSWIIHRVTHKDFKI